MEDSNRPVVETSEGLDAARRVLDEVATEASMHRFGGLGPWAPYQEEINRIHHTIDVSRMEARLFASGAHWPPLRERVAEAEQMAERHHGTIDPLTPYGVRLRQLHAMAVEAMRDSNEPRVESLQRQIQELQTHMQGEMERPVSNFGVSNRSVGFSYMGVPVEERMGSDPRAVRLLGRRGRVEQYALNTEGNPLQRSLEYFISSFERTHGHQPERLLLPSQAYERLRAELALETRPLRYNEFFQRESRSHRWGSLRPNVTVTGVDTVNRTVTLSTEQGTNMQGPYKLHVTTRDGFKKTITQAQPFTGRFYVMSEQIPRVEGFGTPESATIRERRYEYTKKAVFTDIQTGAMTEQMWAVERG